MHVEIPPHSRPIMPGGPLSVIIRLGFPSRRIQSFISVDVRVAARISLIRDQMGNRDRQSAIKSTGGFFPECRFGMMRCRQKDKPRQRRRPPRRIRMSIPLIWRIDSALGAFTSAFAQGAINLFMIDNPVPRRSRFPSVCAPQSDR